MKITIKDLADSMNTNNLTTFEYSGKSLNLPYPTEHQNSNNIRNNPLVKKSYPPYPPHIAGVGEYILPPVLAEPAKSHIGSEVSNSAHKKESTINIINDLNKLMMGIDVLEEPTEFKGLPGKIMTESTPLRNGSSYYYNKWMEDKPGNITGDLLVSPDRKSAGEWLRKHTQTDKKNRIATQGDIIIPDGNGAHERSGLKYPIYSKDYKVEKFLPVNRAEKGIEPPCIDWPWLAAGTELCPECRNADGLFCTQCDLECEDRGTDDEGCCEGRCKVCGNTGVVKKNAGDTKRRKVAKEYSVLAN
ncbi:MAG: hypothetical protein E3J23_08635 [Candidatus Stahlbacteria bacterium]|nr:MAG: hypothetical protein E3J23_08635 [Candidatus Stahlbacteria bacterium]